MSEQKAAYVCNPRGSVVYTGPDVTAAELYAARCALAAMRNRLLALAAELDGTAIPQMGPGQIAKRLREIAGKGAT